MLQAKLSVLPKDILIKILLKVKEEKIYKVKIRNGHKKDTFYVRARSRDDVIEKMRNNEEIRYTILEMFKDESEHSDICLYVNMHTQKVQRLNYRCIQHVSFLRSFDYTDMPLEPHFDYLFDDYMQDKDSTNISIEQIKVIPKFEI